MTDETRVTHGGRLQTCEVLYERGNSVRVRLAGGKCITVPADRLVRPKAPAVPAKIDDAFYERFQPKPLAFRDVDVVVAEHPSELRSVPKPPKPWRSSAYRAFVADMPCCITGETDDVEAHHHGPHAMGQKASDAWCIPLSRAMHRYFHDHGTFPDMTREETDRYAVMQQVVCLASWCERINDAAADYAIRDALQAIVEKDSREP